MKRVVFRVDSGSVIGMGHVMRCLTLALEFKNRDCEVTFISKNHLGYKKNLITSHYPLFVLEGGLEHSDNIKTEDWLGEAWEEDLKKTNLVLSKLGKVDLVVVDHYAIDNRYEEQLICNKVLVIDDMMNRNHNCDFLLDQNSSAELIKYKSLTPSNKQICFFLGPNYSLIRREFLELLGKYSNKIRPFKLSKILVFFGAGDIGNNCIKVAKSLGLKELSQYHFTFILENDHQSFQELSLWASFHKKTVNVLSFTTNMANIMDENDFIIGAGGATSWERILLGIPSAIVSVADNQTKICESLANLGLSYYLGTSNKCDLHTWKNFFSITLQDEEYFQNMAIRCKGFIDGMGARRVANSILENLR